jgi:hypothetical protein
MQEEEIGTFFAIGGDAGAKITMLGSESAGEPGAEDMSCAGEPGAEAMATWWGNLDSWRIG